MAGGVWAVPQRRVSKARKEFVSSYLILREVGESLRAILWDAFSRDPILQPIIQTEDQITFLDPNEAERDQSLKLSLWLYHITENGFMRNQPAGPGGTRTNGSSTTTQRGTPLPLDLYYLMTPLTVPGDTDLSIMGKTLQVLNDNAIIVVRDPETRSAEELRVVSQQMTIQELSHLWDALRRPYRLSAAYIVRVTQIDSDRVVESARVVERGDETRRKAA